MGRDRFENLNQLPYLDMVLKESLRIFPSVPSIGRVLTEDVTLRGYKIPKGCNVGVSIVGLHRNPRVFPDPLKFDPERWSVRARLRGRFKGWRRCSGGGCTMGGGQGAQGRRGAAAPVRVRALLGWAAQLHRPAVCAGACMQHNEKGRASLTHLPVCV